MRTGSVTSGDIGRDPRLSRRCLVPTSIDTGHHRRPAPFDAEPSHVAARANTAVLGRRRILAHLDGGVTYAVSAGGPSWSSDHSGERASMSTYTGPLVDGATPM